LRHIREAVEIQVRTQLLHPDNQEALAEFLRGLGYEPSVDASEPRLTPREMEVLRLMASGYTSWQIANRLAIATGTVRTHVQNIMTKLQLRRRSDLPRWYIPKAGGAFLLWLADEVGAAAAEELAQAVAGWIREHLRRLSHRGTVRVIYGADDKLLAEVPIDQSPES
jgi:DNA-binding CsgD family transcriptional regulator